MLLVAEKEAALDDAELVRVSLEVVAIGTVADEKEPRVDAALDEHAQHADDDVGLLYGGHPSDPAHDEGLVADPEQPSSVYAGSLVVADALVELDAEPDDRELRRRRDVQPDEILLHLGAHGDEHRRRVCEHPLEDAEAARRD